MRLHEIFPDLFARISIKGVVCADILSGLISQLPAVKCILSPSDANSSSKSSSVCAPVLNFRAQFFISFVTTPRLSRNSVRHSSFRAFVCIGLPFLQRWRIVAKVIGSGFLLGVVLQTTHFWRHSGFPGAQALQPEKVVALCGVVHDFSCRIDSLSQLCRGLHKHTTGGGCATFRTMTLFWHSRKRPRLVKSVSLLL